MPDSAQLLDSSFGMTLGMDSYSDPQTLEPSVYACGMNIVCRGGVIKTRPGTKSLTCLPQGLVQGGILFSPLNSSPFLVAAVNGKVYVSGPPFDATRQLPNIQFNPNSYFVSLTICQQSTDYNVNGELYFLDQPKAILIMQDGRSRAAYWDGSTSGQMNPNHSPGDITLPGYDGTPIGLWSCWSNNRLWVSRGNQVFASDIGNPTKFTESQYLNEGRAFYLPGDCTGIVETPDQQGIICFTENEGVFILSSVQDRTKWLTTEGFQKTILPRTGCVAPRSIVLQYGLIWWFSASGLTNLDAALRQNLSSRLTLQDNEMYASKFTMGPNLYSIAAGYYENYLLMSVPAGDKYNRHTWALDQAPFDGNQNAWTSYWTGWRPICWATGMVFGESRSFFISKDYDENNRWWTAFTADQKDNNTSITCFFQSRENNFGNGDRKRFRYAEIFGKEIYGEVSVAAYVAGMKGAYQNILTKDIVASEGQIYVNQQYGPGITDRRFAGNRPQTRNIRTVELGSPSECNGCSVESNIPTNIDRAFSLLVVWHGIFGFNGYRMFAEIDPENFGGECEDDEVAPKSLAFDGCGATELFVNEGPFTDHTAYALECLDNLKEEPFSCSATTYLSEACATGVAVSIISQSVADRLAQERAKELAAHELVITTPFA